MEEQCLNMSSTVNLDPCPKTPRILLYHLPTQGGLVHGAGGVRHYGDKA